MLSIHTVFEGHDSQNPKKLKSFIKEKGIHHLVGIDAYKNGDMIPETMEKYQTGGTPSMAFIDKNGRIRFQKLGGFDQFAAEMFIRMLLEEPEAWALTFYHCLHLIFFLVLFTTAISFTGLFLFTPSI